MISLKAKLIGVLAGLVVISALTSWALWERSARHSLVADYAKQAQAAEERNRKINDNILANRERAFQAIEGDLRAKIKQLEGIEADACLDTAVPADLDSLLGS